MTAIPIDSLVELQDQYSNVYLASPSGARGWVRARREMPKTDPEIYVEWDKDHWRYHGERDGWTYEHHFRLVLNEIFDYERCSDFELAHMTDPALADPDVIAETLESQHVEVLAAAEQAALEAEGYFVITLTPRQEGEYVIYQPQIFMHALNPLAEEMIDAQIMHSAIQLLQAGLFSRFSSPEGDE